MKSPTKADVLIEEFEEDWENDRDDMPEVVYQDFMKHQRFIFYALMYLNGTALWAYFSFLSTQDYFGQRFANSGMDFSFLTTLCQSWPMVIAQTFQTLTGLEKTLGQTMRMYIGYVGFFISSALVIAFCAVEFANEQTSAILVLICIGITGVCSALTESTYYSMAALLPDPKFTTSVQIGNGAAGIVNVTILTVLRLVVGGTQENSDSTTLSFYLFFGLLLVIVISAIVLYHYLMSLPCITYLMERNEKATIGNQLGFSSPWKTLCRLANVFKVIWVPTVAEFLAFFVSFAIYPGVGCAAARNLAEPYMKGDHSLTSNWYCSPGIIGGFQYGDFFGRAIPMFVLRGSINSHWALGLSMLRVIFVPLLLMGVAGTPLYAFGYGNLGAIPYNIVLNFVLGLSNGLLTTVTMRQAPTLLCAEDRETGGSLIALFFFWGVTLGSTLGFVVDEYNILGV